MDSSDDHKFESYEYAYNAYIMLKEKPENDLDIEEKHDSEPEQDTHAVIEAEKARSLAKNKARPGARKKEQVTEEEEEKLNPLQAEDLIEAERTKSRAKKNPNNKARPGASKRGNVTEEDEEKVIESARVITYSHNGKHCPPKIAENNEDLLKKFTKSHGAVSLYMSRNRNVVAEWEKTAIEKGLLLSDESNTVHIFAQYIGADQGEMTRAIRMDGFHHGHPIIEFKDGCKTSFDSYIKSEIINAVTEKSKKRLKIIADWLIEQGYNPESFMNKVPKNLQPS